MPARARQGRVGRGRSVKWLLPRLASLKVADPAIAIELID